MTWYAMKASDRYEVTLGGCEWYQSGPKTVMITDTEFGWTSWSKLQADADRNYSVHHLTEDEKPRGVALSLSEAPKVGDWVEVADPYVWPIPELEKQ